MYIVAWQLCLVLLSDVVAGQAVKYRLCLTTWLRRDRLEIIALCTRQHSLLRISNNSLICMQVKLWFAQENIDVLLKLL